MINDDELKRRRILTLPAVLAASNPPFILSQGMKVPLTMEEAVVDQSLA